MHTVKKQVSLGASPAAAKRDGKKIVKEEQRLSDYTVAFMKNVRLADSTRTMKQVVIYILPAFGNRLIHEINPAGLRAICDKLVKNRGAKATALQVREIVGSMFTYAIDHGLDVVNPAEYVKASSIATFEARERALKPREIKIFSPGSQRDRGIRDTKARDPPRFDNTGSQKRIDTSEMERAISLKPFGRFPLSV